MIKEAISTERALKLTLEGAANYIDALGGDSRKYRQALLAEQPAPVAKPHEQEPVAWYEGPPPFPQDQEWFIAETIYGDRVVLRSLDEGREHKGNYAFTTADSTYMKAENVRRWMQFPDCHYIPPAQQQEPVAVVSGYYGGQCVILPIDPARIFNSNTALYTSPPPQRKPLTDEELANIFYKNRTDLLFYTKCARAIEAAHGIKENT